jgi:hypothetical protein
MDKKWYNYFVSFDKEQSTATSGESASAKAPRQTPSAAQTVADIAASVKTIEPKFTAPVTNPSSFEDIYKAAEIRSPAHGFTIFKIADMLVSEHIRSLPLEVKRSSVLLALETAGVKVQEVIEDAVRRDRALDTFEAIQKRSLEQLENQKKSENLTIQAEIDRLVKEHQAKIQLNNDQVAKQKDQFAKWCVHKQQEEQRIADAIAPFVTDNPISNTTTKKTS